MFWCTMQEYILWRYVITGIYKSDMLIFHQYIHSYSLSHYFSFISLLFGALFLKLFKVPKL